MCNYDSFDCDVNNNTIMLFPSKWINTKMTQVYNNLKTNVIFFV